MKFSALLRSVQNFLAPSYRFSVIYLDLVLLNLTLWVLAVGVAGTPLGPIRVVVGISAVFFIPGYLILAIVYPRLDTFDWPERLGLSVPLSIAVMVLLGLALALSPLGFGLSTVVATETLLAVGLAAGAGWRRWSTPQDLRFFRMPRHHPLRNAFPSNVVDRGIMAAGALVILGLVSYVGYQVFVVPPGNPTTEFTMLDSNGSTTSYPTQALPNDSVLVTLIVANREHVPKEYRVFGFVDRDQAGAWGPFLLGDGEVWSELVSIDLGNHSLEPGARPRIRFQLLGGPEGDEPLGEVGLSVTISSSTALQSAGNGDSLPS